MPHVERGYNGGSRIRLNFTLITQQCRIGEHMIEGLDIVTGKEIELDQFIRPGGDEEENHAMEPSGRRRHSVATPLLYGDHGQDSLADSFSSMRVDDGGMMRGNAGQSYAAFDPTTGQYVMQPMYPEDINDYFENQEPRARAWVEGTRNLQMQQYAQRWPIYVVEFKAGRKDFFFVPENSGFTPKKGDFVVVEADRGKDLGKVVHDSIRSQQELQTYQQLHAANFLDNHPGKEVHAKRIYRLAQPAELSMLSAKMADEEKAMNICQGKVRSKRLPMEVVDAEYQWWVSMICYFRSTWLIASLCLYQGSSQAHLLLRCGSPDRFPRART